MKEQLWTYDIFFFKLTTDFCTLYIAYDVLYMSVTEVIKIITIFNKHDKSEYYIIIARLQINKFVLLIIMTPS